MLGKGIMEAMAQDLTPTDQDSLENARGYRRVDVRLKVAIVLDRETACIARTLNLSEGGMLLCDYNGPPLVRGRLVGVNLRGVLSDSDTPDADHFLMRVVRQRGDIVALRFAEDD